VTHEYQGSVEVLVVLLDVVRVILHRLSLVKGIEVEAGVVGLDGLEERSESILKAMRVQRLAIRATYGLQTYHFGSICSGGESLSPFSSMLARAA
jgi:hypothetical protein